MDSLAFGHISNDSAGHIIETITNNKRSIVFNGCNLNSSIERLFTFHIACVKAAVEIEKLKYEYDVSNYIYFILKNIFMIIYHSASDDALTLGLIADIINEGNYIRYTVIAPFHPEKYQIIEQL